MGSSSRDLLHLEHKNITATSALESALLVCKKNSVADSNKSHPGGKPVTTNVAKSQVLGKVRDFLGVISEANKQLQHESKDNAQKYDIEELTGTESEVIEMDLMLGIADLHTPEAIAAAESAVTSGQQLVPLDSDSSESESEATSDDDDDDEADIDNNNDSDDDDKTLKHKTSKSAKDDSNQAVGRNGSKKRPKIIEMC
ncbi:uncharacterized protein [Euphorbia lathyris]|uniref:uncharacterized protein n=1 Tax=Euphorbia lathyris TaxID=212925 RepID=UPI003313FC80